MMGDMPEVCVPSKINVLKSLPSKAVVSGGGAFGKGLSYGERILMNGISALGKTALGNSLVSQQDDRTRS